MTTWRWLTLRFNDQKTFQKWGLYEILSHSECIQRSPGVMQLGSEYGRSTSKVNEENHNVGIVLFHKMVKRPIISSCLSNMTAFYLFPLSCCLNYNQNYYSSFAQLYPYYEELLLQYLEILSRIMRYMPRLCFLKDELWDRLVSAWSNSKTVWFHQTLTWWHQIT